MQALWADWNWELVTPSCCGVSLGISPLLVESGKFGTPLERMQRERASCRELVDPPAFDEPPEPADDGLPPHAATSRARPAMAMMAAVGAAIRILHMPASLAAAGAGHIPRRPERRSPIRVSVKGLWPERVGRPGPDVRGID